MKSAIDAAGSDQIIRPTRRHYIVIFALTLFYFFVMLYQESMVKYAVTYVPAFLIILVMKHRLTFWFAAFSMAIVLGGRGVPIGEFAPSIVTLCAFTFYACYVFRRMFWKELPIPFTKTSLFVIAALLLQIASIFVSTHMHGQHTINAVREGSGIFIMMPLMFIVSDIFRGEKGIVQLTKIILVMLLVAATIGMIQRANSTGFSRVDLTAGYLMAGRFQATFGGPNIFSGFLELCVPTALAAALVVRHKFWKILALVAFGLGLLCVLYTFSRGGFITSILASALILVIRFRKKLIIALLLLLLFTMAIVVNKETFNRQVNLIVNPSSAVMEPTLLHRYITYQRHWYEFTQKPLFGSGWGSREYYWGRTLLYSFWEVRHTTSIRSQTQFGGLNSLFLNSMVKGGVISLAALCLIIFAVWYASVKALRRRRGLIVVGFVVSMAAFLGHQLIDNLLQWQQLSAVFWTNMGALIAISLLKKGPDAEPLEKGFLPGESDGHREVPDRLDRTPDLSY